MPVRICMLSKYHMEPTTLYNVCAGYIVCELSEYATKLDAIALCTETTGNCMRQHP